MIEVLSPQDLRLRANQVITDRQAAREQEIEVATQEFVERHLLVLTDTLAQGANSTAEKGGFEYTLVVPEIAPPKEVDSGYFPDRPARTRLFYALGEHFTAQGFKFSHSSAKKSGGFNTSQSNRLSHKDGYEDCKEGEVIDIFALDWRQETQPTRHFGGRILKWAFGR